MVKVLSFGMIHVGAAFAYNSFPYVKNSNKTAICWLDGSVTTFENANHIQEAIINDENEVLVKCKVRDVTPSRLFTMLGYPYRKLGCSAGAYQPAHTGNPEAICKGNPDAQVWAIYPHWLERGTKLVCKADEAKPAPLVEILQNEDGTEYSKIPNKTFFRADGFLFYKTGQGNAINIIAGNEGTFLTSELVQQVSVRIEITPV